MDEDPFGGEADFPQTHLTRISADLSGHHLPSDPWDEARFSLTLVDVNSGQIVDLAGHDKAEFFSFSLDR